MMILRTDFTNLNFKIFRYCILEKKQLKHICLELTRRLNLSKDDFERTISQLINKCSLPHATHVFPKETFFSSFAESSFSISLNQH